MAEKTEHQKILDQKRKEKEKQNSSDTPTEKRELVMNGAKLECKYAQGEGTLNVTSNEILLQDKVVATMNDNNNMLNLQFKGTCGHPIWPSKKIPPPPCMSVIKLDKWKKIGTNLIQEQTNLVKESTIICNPDFNNAVAKPIPKVESIKVEEIPKILDAYFVKWSFEKGKPVEIEEEVYDKKSKKKVKVKKQTETKKIITEKITERGLSYQLALIVDTSGLAGKKIKIKIKSGSKKVLSDVDAEIKLIDLKDIESISEAAKYKDVKPKDVFEIEVGNLSKDPKIENSSDFKDKAVLKLMLNQRADDLSFDLAELIMGDPNKEALIYIEVESNEPKIEYFGIEGKSGTKNTFLNEASKFFKIKYFEQPWVIKAREEQKAKISEATNCDKIINEYHQINRQNKPKECANTDNSSWCASFVGWCLAKSGYSAQLDAGAYSYGHEETRYREGFKKVSTDKKALTKEEFSTPIWGKLLPNAEPTVGSVCVLSKGHHVSIAVGMSSDKKTIYYLGGNQGDRVCVATFGGKQSSIYPIEYTIKTEDYELPIYYTKNEKVSS